MDSCAAATIAYIPARLGESRSASFKFTHDTWSAITRERDQFPPELQYCFLTMGNEVHAFPYRHRRVEAHQQSGDKLSEQFVRYDIAEIGLVYTPVTARDAEGNATEGGELVPGWHMLGVWRGAWEAVPAAIQAYHVDRSSLDWWPRYG